MRRFDCHTHSRHSDGTLSPREVVKRAEASRLELLILTDHDTIAGLEEAAAAATAAKIHFSLGIEINSNYPEGQVHFLGYGIRAQDPSFLAALARLRGRRRERADAILRRLRELGLPLSPEELPSSPDLPLGRPHVADLMRRKGIVRTRSEAFEKYLSRGRPGFAEPLGPTPEEAIALIRDAGGFPSLAHPKTAKTALKHLSEWVRAGLEGVEAYYAAFSEEERKHWAGVAAEFNLLSTGGSDFHGPGTGRDRPLGVEVPESVFDRFSERLARCG